jgi:hypothetical protein
VSSPVYIWEKHCSHASHNSAAPLSSTIKFYVVYDEACIAQKECTLIMNLLLESQTKIKKLSDTFWTFSVT